MRSASSLDLLRPLRFFFSGRLVVMSARDEAEQIVEVRRRSRARSGARRCRSTSARTGSRAGGGGSRKRTVLAQRVGSGENMRHAALELVEHARADLGVAEEVHLAVRARCERVFTLPMSWKSAAQRTSRRGTA